MIRANQLDAHRSCVLVIDIQEKLLPLVADPEGVVRASRKLLDGVRIFSLPVIVTEQYSKGLGATHEPIRASCQASNAIVLEKPTFSACGHDPVRDALLEIDRPQTIVIGIETHVCVLQTALDLVTMDYDVFVCADAVASRGRLDHDVALNRCRQEGVRVTTVESVLFELCQRCDTDQFKKMLEIIKE